MSSIKCPHCGLTNFATEEVCKRCGKPLTFTQIPPASVTESDDEMLPVKTSHNLPPLPQNEVSMITKSQGYILIALLSIGLLLLTLSAFKQSKYEYKVMEVMTESNDRTGDGAMKFTSIKINEQQMSAMGAEGWELASTLLEMETAYPNFGKSEYVTGLQPNIRPQRAVLIFKRLIR